MSVETPSRERWFLGTSLRIVCDARDTDSQLAVMEQRARRGFSPPLHVHHREDTALYVLEGELTVVVGETTRTVGAGGFAWLPRDVPHTFRVESDEVHLLELATPAGIEGFHVETSEPAGRPGVPSPAPPDIPRLVTAFADHGGEIIGAPI